MKHLDSFDKTLIGVQLCAGAIFITYASLLILLAVHYANKLTIVTFSFIGVGLSVIMFGFVLIRMCFNQESKKR